ncbi:MAG TPA: hypothetical protein VFC42_03155 [Methylomirabilota bacterium]|jgi:hypothetical protein|nr:hypothetical protein [Methylomirabilota bacterium]
MARKRSKEATRPVPPPVDVPAPDRAALIAAYQAGLITAWKHEGERGYRLTTAGHQDDYVDVAKLGKYLERLAAAS